MSPCICICVVFRYSPYTHGYSAINLRYDELIYNYMIIDQICDVIVGHFGRLASGFNKLFPLRGCFSTKCFVAKNGLALSRMELFVNSVLWVCCVSVCYLNQQGVNNGIIVGGTLIDRTKVVDNH